MKLPNMSRERMKGVIEGMQLDERVGGNINLDQLINLSEAVSNLSKHDISV